MITPVNLNRQAPVALEEVETVLKFLLQDLSVIAFASHCRVDQAGRPIAGLVNFCPFTLMRSRLTEQFLYMVRRGVL